MTVNVTSVNDAPAGADNAVTTNEDTALVFSTGAFGGFSDALTACHLDDVFGALRVSRPVIGLKRHGAPGGEATRA